MTVAKASFEVTAWDELPTAVGELDVSKVSRATVRKTFTGLVNGTSVADVMMTGGEDGQGYVAIDFFEGEVDGRSGSFAMEHGGVRGLGLTESFGYVIPGSGTGDLSGIRGTAALEHTDAGATFTLDYELE